MRRYIWDGMTTLMETASSSAFDNIFREEYLPERKQGDSFFTNGIVSLDLRNTILLPSSCGFSSIGSSDAEPVHMLFADVFVRHNSSTTRDSLVEELLDILQPRNGTNGARHYLTGLVSGTNLFILKLLLTDVTEFAGVELAGGEVAEEALTTLEFSLHCYKT